MRHTLQVTVVYADLDTMNTEEQRRQGRVERLEAVLPPDGNEPKGDGHPYPCHFARFSKSYADRDARHQMRPVSQSRIHAGKVQKECGHEAHLSIDRVIHTDAKRQQPRGIAFRMQEAEPSLEHEFGVAIGDVNIHPVLSLA